MKNSLINKLMPFYCSLFGCHRIHFRYLDFGLSYKFEAMLTGISLRTMIVIDLVSKWICQYAKVW